jgi:hypothetical protein
MTGKVRWNETRKRKKREIRQREKERGERPAERLLTTPGGDL